MSPDVTRKIAVDWSRGRPPTGYTPEMLEVRARIIAEHAALKARRAGAPVVLDVFDDLDGL